MKKRYYLATAVIAYLIFIIAGTPASAVLALIGDKQPQLKIEGVSGSLWHGNAENIKIQSTHVLEQVDWSFCWWRLITGEACFDIEASYRNHPLQLQLGIGILGKLNARQLITEQDAKIIGELAGLPLGELSGTLFINLDRLSWHKGEVPQAEGTINWSNAEIRVAETVKLGEVEILLNESSEFPLDAIITNNASQLNLAGNMHITDEGNYNLELKLTPGKGASNNLQSSLALFAKKQSDGSFVFNNNGHLNQLGMM